MSEDTNTTVPDSNPETVSPATNAYDEILITIKNKVLQSSDALLNTIVDAKVKTEVDRRAGILTQAFQKIEELTANLKKEKNKFNVTYSEDGQTEFKTRSKENVDSIKKMEEQLKNLQNNFDLAFSKNTVDVYEKLEKAIKAGGNNQSKE